MHSQFTASYFDLPFVEVEPLIEARPNTAISIDIILSSQHPRYFVTAQANIYSRCFIISLVSFVFPFHCLLCSILGHFRDHFLDAFGQHRISRPYADFIIRSCYVWEDRGPHSVTGLGIERFTEGRHWSASRVR